MLFAGLVSTAGAGIIVNNGLPNQSGGSDMNSFLEADDFTLAGPFALNLIRFWSLQGSASDYSGSIQWSICKDDAGLPGPSCQSGTATPTGVATGNSAFGLDEYSYEIAINELLGAGTYWLVLHNGPNASIPDTAFYWAWANGDGGNSQSSDLLADSGWVGNFAELAFQLEGERRTVPEPATLVLLATGLAAAALRRRRNAVVAA